MYSPTNKLVVPRSIFVSPIKICILCGFKKGIPYLVEGKMTDAQGIKVDMIWDMGENLPPNVDEVFVINMTEDDEDEGNHVAKKQKVGEVGDHDCGIAFVIAFVSSFLLFLVFLAFVLVTLSY